MNKTFAPFQKAHGSSLNFRSNESPDLGSRLYLLPAGLTLLFLILFVRLFTITVVRGAHFRARAEDNRIKEISLEAPRGTIRDRRGIPLTQSDPKTARRTYRGPEAYSHILGYRQIASREHMEHDVCPTPLHLGDKVGVKGLEEVFECVLRGQKGRKLVEVDSHGKAIRTITELPPRKGHGITTSLDSLLQEKAHEVVTHNAITTSVEVDLTKKKLAIVATKPRTGEILLLYSSPTFDPTSFEREDKARVAHYLKSPDKVLFNRALEGTYPPGSVFKPFVAAGALQEGVIDADYTYTDRGFIQAGPLKFGNWYYLQYGKTEGPVDVVKALRRSTDTFFYKVGEKLTPEKVKKWALLFGLGRETGIRLPDSTGLIPSAFWKQDRVGDRWYLGDTYNLSIGQGYVLTTPLQINRATSVLANGGYLCTPKLLRARTNPSDDPFLRTDQTVTCQKLPISKETLQLVKKGMKQACEPGGTGWPFFDFRVKSSHSRSKVSQELVEVGKEETNSTNLNQLSETGLTRPIPVGCKTGTAQSHTKSGLPHAWFTVFAPYENPEIVLTVMVEESGEGSNIAAPIAKEILKAYFERSE